MMKLMLVQLELYTKLLSKVKSIIIMLIHNSS